MKFIDQLPVNIDSLPKSAYGRLGAGWRISADSDRPLTNQRKMIWQLEDRHLWLTDSTQLATLPCISDTRPDFIYPPSPQNGKLGMYIVYHFMNWQEWIRATSWPSWECRMAESELCAEVNGLKISENKQWWATRFASPSSCSSHPFRVMKTRSKGIFPRKPSPMP